MGLGDVSQQVVPKVAIISPACKEGSIASRYLTPHKCHKSHAITGAMCIASAGFVENTIVTNILGGVCVSDQTFSIEHPSGKIELQVVLDKSESEQKKIESIAVVRTARRLFEGHVITR